MNFSHFNLKHFSIAITAKKSQGDPVINRHQLMTSTFFTIQHEFTA